MPIKKTKPALKKTRQREILYPILKECSTLVSDKFWKQFYEDLACGKSTKGLYISNGIIQTSNKRNGINYSITDKAPEVIVKELHHLLLTYTNICSKKDMNQKRSIILELEEELKAYDESEWTSIKRKNVRNMLLVDYAVKLHKKYNLDWKTTINAYHTIINAFENKTHTSKDVNYSHGKINHINDIDYEDNKIINTRNISTNDQDDTILNFPINTFTNQSSNSIMLQNVFDNYLNAWLKHIKSC